MYPTLQKEEQDKKAKEFFCASRGWLANYLRRNKISKRTPTHYLQKVQ